MREQTNHIYKELRQRILDGVLRPAESLTEIALAAELKVSRNTIRKALLKLERENLVVVEENKRTRVRWFTLEEVLQYMEVREILECFVIRQSFPFLGSAELGEMHTALVDVKRSYTEYQFIKYAEHISRYYNVIYRVCPNRPAVEMIMVIKNQLKRYNIRTILIPGRVDESFKEHKAILSAVEQGDVDKAEALMHLHMSNIRKVVQKHFEFFV